MQQNIVISHSGKQHSYQVALNLKHSGFLKRFYTSSYVRSRFLQRIIETFRLNYFQKRFLSGLDGNKVRSNWLLELPEILQLKFRGKNAEFERLVYRRDELFDKRVAANLKDENPSIFWGFQGSCLLSLKEARRLGITSICELATGHVTAAKRILEEEARLHPEWADSINNMIFPIQTEKRLMEEPFEADWVVAASEFTRNTLVDAGVVADKIYKLPLGFDVKHIPFDPERVLRKRTGKIKLLYAGVVTQRKGIKYLLDAMRMVDRSRVELHIIGHIQGEGKALKEYKDIFTWHGPLAQYDLFRRYHEFDALVLPTVFEGFGLVIVEALAAGLPVITTVNSIGPDVIVNDRNGYLVGIRDSLQLAKAIETLCNKSFEELEEMKLNSRNSAMNFTWENHRQNLDEFLRFKVNG